MFHRFEALGPEPTLVASTDLTYDESEHLAKLARVVQRAYERGPTGGYLAAETPALELTYSPLTISPTLGEVDRDSLRGLPVGVGGEFRLVDLDGEGLPGVLSQDGDALHYHRPRGGGRFGARRELPVGPVPARLGRGAQLVDVDGDGRLEVVVWSGSAAGVVARRDPDGWAPWVEFAQSPELDRDDPRAQQLDLDGDGVPDLLLDRGDDFLWFPSEGQAGYSAPRSVPKPSDERDGPAFVFADDTAAIFIADMTGDGLADLVRVQPMAVHYWPNLGYGRFGGRVTMGAPPSLASDEGFVAGHLRLADIDGSGTTDIVYLDTHGARVWFNQAGNGFSTPTALPTFPGLDGAIAVEVDDLLGKGTACLVWSSEGDGGGTSEVRYLDVLPQKPHLLLETRNNMGVSTRLAYEPSTQQYLRDLEAGRPWATRLPFPAHVLTRVEHHDAIARRRTVQRYAYHHGYYDGREREFRGFAMVERWDTEGYEDFNHDGLFSLSSFDGVEEDLHQPPVHTKTWFHTGAFMGRSRISAQLREEYWDGDPQAEAWRVADTTLPDGLTGAEAQEAVRALRGLAARTEVYALDGSDAESIPYAVTESNQTIVKLQDKGEHRHAVFSVHRRESISLAYERDPDNPRVTHDTVLEVDDYGNVLARASVAYPARNPTIPEQAQGAVLVGTSAFCGVDDVAVQPDVYRAGVAFERQGYELHGVVPSADAPLAFAALRQAVADAPRVEPEAAEPAQRLRLLSSQRSRFYADDLAGPLQLGECGTRALLFVSETAALTPAQIEAVFGPSEVDDALLTTEGGYLFDEGLWWARSGRSVHDPARFFVAVQGLDPFGNATQIEHDATTHFVTRLEDPLGNVVTAEHDYRVLAPRRIVDPNGHASEAGFDIRGLVAWTAVMGRDGEGDTPEDPTTVSSYDIFAWRDRGEPNWSRTRTRETHGDPQTRWLESVTYADGAGNVILHKATAAPGPAPLRDAGGALMLEAGGPVIVELTERWVGTGRTVLDNNGNPLKQYEPYFSATDAYEDEAELREQGVTPLLHYDPLGRLVRTELPDGTSAATEFSPWRHSVWDPNDRVVGSAWAAERAELPPGDAGAHALAVTLPHDATPTVAHLDAQGRTVRAVAHEVVDGADVFVETRSVLDVQGRVVEVIDARGNVAETRSYGLAGQSLRVASGDAGVERGLVTIVGVPLRSFSARGFVARARYDALWRPTHGLVRGPEPDAAERVVSRMVYGESLPDPLPSNSRGRVLATYDGAGVVRSEGFDFKGNPLGQTRRFAREYRQTLDWAALDGVDGSVAAIEPAAEPLLEAESFVVATQYDGLSRPSAQTSADGSVTSIAYDDGGLLQRIDVAVRGEAPSPVVTRIDYDAQGRRSRIDLGNGTRTDYTYDPRTFRLARLRTTRGVDAAVVQDLRYTYDPVGNITEIADGAHQPVFFANDVVSATQRFAYDAHYRLREASGREHIGQAAPPTPSELTPGPQPHASDPAAMRRYVQRYVFDAVGNLTRMQHEAADGSWTRDYTLADDGNRLLRTQAPGDPPGVALTYDAAGNMTSMPHLAAMGWDHGERLREVDLGGGGTAYYVYDGGGTRVRKVIESQTGARTRERLYIGALEVYRERTGESLRLERQTLHVRDDTGRIAMVDTQTVDDGAEVGEPISRWRYVYANHLGTTALELDAVAAVISYEEFHPYGTSAYRAVDSSVDVALRRYRYIGQERDDETGLDLMGARYYAPWLGRWTAADPIGLGGGINRYAYGGGNPITLSDPTGTRAEEPNGQVGEVTGGMEWIADPGAKIVFQGADGGVMHVDQVIVFDDDPVTVSPPPEPPTNDVLAFPQNRTPQENHAAIVAERERGQAVIDGMEASINAGRGEALEWMVVGTAAVMAVPFAIEFTAGFIAYGGLEGGGVAAAYLSAGDIAAAGSTYIAGNTALRYGVATAEAYSAAESAASGEPLALPSLPAKRLPAASSPSRAKAIPMGSRAGVNELPSSGEAIPLPAAPAPARGGAMHGPWGDPTAERPPGGGTWGEHLERIGGGPAPEGPPISHGHHIFLKRGRGAEGRAIAEEGQAILREAGLDPILGRANLTHAPLHGTGIHSRATQREILEGLRALKGRGAGQQEYIDLLQSYGERARNARVNQ